MNSRLHRLVMIQSLADAFSRASDDLDRNDWLALAPRIAAMWPPTPPPATCSTYAKRQRDQKRHRKGGRS
jgi:hypothetical protein